jgi:hypothetical protein
MEQVFNDTEVNLFDDVIQQKAISTAKPFIQANTIESSLEDIKTNHIIPVFHRDNETVISHSDFIDTLLSVITELYPTETILRPSVRVSHPIKGRVPSAKEKPSNQLQDHEKTLYYERMAFIIEIPSISDNIDGGELSLTVGGVKSYSLDNLYSKKGADEHFKAFIGFKNSVCTNLNIWSDGYMSDIVVKSPGQLKACIRTLIEGYNATYHMHALRKLNQYSLTEHQFAHLIGRCRMYNHLPHGKKKDLSPLLLNDTQLGAIVKDYYRDNSFCKDEHGNINLWRLYNLFTGNNRSSYIDSFLDRSVNSFHFVEDLRFALDNKTTCWFLN